MRTIMRSVALVVCAVMATACGGRGGTIPAGTPVVHPQWTSCETEAAGAIAGAEATEMPRVGDFPVVAVMVCDQKPQRRPDGGEDLVAVEGRGTRVAALVAALRLPDEPRSRLACTMELPILPWFAVLDDQDRWIRPGLPIDGCGKIRIEVREALVQVPLTTVASHVVRELESRGAVAAGCAQLWADMVSVETTQGSSARPGRGVDPFTAGQPIRLCAYGVPPDERGSAKPAGEFDHGGVLDAGRQAQLQQALVSAAPAQPCSTPAGRFAVLLPADGNRDDVYVELDGCRRILIHGPQGSVLAQADHDLVALLEE
jgi:hypothetical protein